MPRLAELQWASYQHFPYERELAMREVESLLGARPSVEGGRVVAYLNGHPNELLARLTYFEAATFTDGARLETQQFELERTAAKGKRSKRQATRYSAHGLHEYRGKFNPQIVRAIANLMNLSEKSRVLDPFCGSGTTLVEGAHMGWAAAVGVDMNPLAVYISNAKLLALKADPKRLRIVEQKLLGRLGRLFRNVDYSSGWSARACSRLAGADWQASLSDYEYLSRWYPQSVLAQAGVILREISGLAGSLAPVFKLALSDLAREASWQDPADLRIRRRKETLSNYPLVPRFIEIVQRNLAVLIEARAVAGPMNSASLRALDGDIRLRTPELDAEGLFDAVITSPPYATALPYIDTQRLSLVLLGLVERSSLRELESRIIGTREIKRAQRIALEKELSGAQTDLPISVTKLCGDMMRSSQSAKDGFRRKNMAALVLQYFQDMRRALANIAACVRSSGELALVVGPNQTTLGGKLFVVETASLLADVAKSSGDWIVTELLPLDAYHRFDIHSKNSIRHETLLRLKRA